MAPPPGPFSSSSPASSAPRPTLRVVRVASSLPLQKLLYFNALFSLAFGACHATSAAWKVLHAQLASPLSVLVLPLTVLVWAALEVVRLRYAYLGNLHEQVPALSAFWLLTVLPQAPLVAYMSALQFEPRLRLQVDLVMGAGALLFIALELHFALGTIRALIRKQTADFYLGCREDARAADFAREQAARAEADSAARRREEEEELERLQAGGDARGGGGGGGGGDEWGAGGVGGGVGGGGGGLSQAELDAAVAAGVGVATVAREGARALATPLGLGGGGGGAGGGGPSDSAVLIGSALARAHGLTPDTRRQR